jgi:hypothetical protein
MAKFSSSLASGLPRHWLCSTWVSLVSTIDGIQQAPQEETTKASGGEVWLKFNLLMAAGVLHLQS